MINLIIKGKKTPGKKLARRIAYCVCPEELHQEAMYFYLRGMHKDYDRIKRECPDAFEDFTRSRGQGEVEIV